MRREYLRENLEKLRQEEDYVLGNVANTDPDSANPVQQVSRGLYEDRKESMQFNVQTCEVYLRDCALIPVPRDISSHKDFKQVFQDNSNSLVCIMNTCCYNRTITFMHGGKEYEVKAWKPFLAESVALNLDDDNKPFNHKFFLGGLPDQPCYNIPDRVKTKQDWLTFLNRKYKPYEKASCGWVSILFDPWFEEFLPEKQQNYYNWKSLAWIEENAASLAERTSGRVRLLLYLGPMGDRETSGYSKTTHPGAFFEVKLYCPIDLTLAWTLTFTRMFMCCNNCVFLHCIQVWALQQHNILFVFALQESGRRIQRRLVFSSDCRFALRSLPQTMVCRDVPGLSYTQFAGKPTFHRPIECLPN